MIAPEKVSRTWVKIREKAVGNREYSVGNRDLGLGSSEGSIIYLP